MEPVLLSTEMEKAERLAIKKLSLSEPILREHAGLAIFQALKNRWGRALKHTRGLILVGPGNNGADAVVLSRLLSHEGYQGFEVFKASSASFSPEKLNGIDWCVDGLFGTGLSKPLTGKYLALVQALNAKKNIWVLSIDIPSGLSSDTGRPMGDAVKASHTVALGFYKRGHLTALAANYVGELELATIQIPRDIIDSKVFLATDFILPERPAATHKGSYGHVYVWAGEEEKMGASLISAEASYRSGCGLVTLVGDKALRDKINKELMLISAEAWLKSHVKDQKAVLVIGPGLGVNEKNTKYLFQLLKTKLPIVFDADAITILSSHKKEALKLLSERKPEINLFTPHPKEASRMAGISTEEIEADRYSFCQDLAKEWNSFVLLKGKGTLISDPKGNIRVVNQGNTLLAKGGSGDLLAGLVASLVAQGMSAEEALSSGSFIQGLCAERVKDRRGEEISGLVTDLIKELPHVFRECHGK
jgi:NAD(P)H-hydrate epimerase